MIMLLKQLILNAKVLLGGASSTAINGLSDKIPTDLFDMSFFTGTTSILGFAVPTFIIYFFFSSED